VPVFPAGYQPQQADFLGWWYQTAAFMQNRIVFRADQATTATTLPSSGAPTLITYDNVLEDPYSGWSAGTHLWTPPAGYSGWYHVTITVRIANNGALVDLRPMLAGTYTYTLGLAQTANISSSSAGASGTYRVYLIGGQDGIGAQAELLNASAGANTFLTAGQRSTLEIAWIAAQP
jgi:hypothetical protein